MHDKTFELLNRQNMRMQRFAEANPQNPNVFRIAGAASQRSNSLASLLPGSQLKKLSCLHDKAFELETR